MIKERRRKMKWNPDDFQNIKSTQNICFVQSFHVYPQPEQPMTLQRNSRAPHSSFLCLIPSHTLSSSHTGLLVFLQTHSALSYPIPHCTVGFLQTTAGLSSTCILSSFQNASLTLTVYGCLLN